MASKRGTSISARGKRDEKKTRWTMPVPVGVETSLRPLHELSSVPHGHTMVSLSRLVSAPEAMPPRVAIGSPPCGVLNRREQPVVGDRSYVTQCRHELTRLAEAIFCLGTALGDPEIMSILHPAVHQRCLAEWVSLKPTIDIVTGRAGTMRSRMNTRMDEAAFTAAGQVLYAWLRSDDSAIRGFMRVVNANRLLACAMDAENACSACLGRAGAPECASISEVDWLDAVVAIPSSSLVATSSASPRGGTNEGAMATSTSTATSSATVFDGINDDEWLEAVAAMPRLGR